MTTGVLSDHYRGRTSKPRRTLRAKRRCTEIICRLQDIQERPRRMLAHDLEVRAPPGSPRYPPAMVTFDRIKYHHPIPAVQSVGIGNGIPTGVPECGPRYVETPPSGQGPGNAWRTPTPYALYKLCCDTDPEPYRVYIGDWLRVLLVGLGSVDCSSWLPFRWPGCPRLVRGSSVVERLSTYSRVAYSDGQGSMVLSL